MKFFLLFLALFAQSLPDLWRLAASTDCSVTQFTCKNCPILIRFLTSIVETSVNHTQKTAAFIARNKFYKSIYVVFRGTDNLSNGVSDLNASKKGELFDGHVDSNFQAHEGFYNSWQSLQGSKDHFSALIKNHADKNPNYKIYFVGHSLGGAMALLQSVKYNLYNSAHSSRINVVTFGQPRVANLEFVEYINSLPFASRIQRVVANGDPVPRLPTQSMGFYHTKNQESIDGSTTTNCVVDETKDDPSICLGSFWDSSISSHFEYFGTSVSCKGFF